MKTRSHICRVTLRPRVRSPTIEILIGGLRSWTIITRCHRLHRVVVMVVVMKMRLVHGGGGCRRREIWRILRLVGMGRVVPMVGILGVVERGIFGPRWHGILR